MSEPKTLADVLKSSPEVTSLASADRLLAVDANGNPERIRRTKLISKSNSIGVDSPQWIRLFSFTTSYLFFQLASSFYNNPGNSILIHALLNRDSQDYCNVEIISHLKNLPNGVFSKMRVLRKDSDSPAYMDVYYTPTKYNNVFLAIMPGVGDPEPLLEPNASIPSGYSVKEFDMAVRGGKTLRVNQLRRVAERRAA